MDVLDLSTSRYVIMVLIYILWYCHYGVAINVGGAKPKSSRIGPHDTSNFVFLRLAQFGHGEGHSEICITHVPVR